MPSDNGFYCMFILDTMPNTAILSQQVQPPLYLLRGMSLTNAKQEVVHLAVKAARMLSA